VLHWRFCMFGRLTFLALFTLSALPLGGCAVESAPAAEPPADVGAEARESARDIYLPPLTRTVSGRVPQGATLATLFTRHELDETHPLIETIRGVFDPRRLRVDNPYHLVVGVEDGALRKFEYHVDDDEFLQVNRTAAGFDAALVPYRQARIEQVLEPVGVAVTIEAEHTCMTMRGVKKPGSRMVTSVTRGAFRDNPATRAEFFDAVQRQ